MSHDLSRMSRQCNSMNCTCVLLHEEALVFGGQCLEAAYLYHGTLKNGHGWVYPRGWLSCSKLTLTMATPSPLPPSIDSRPPAQPTYLPPPSLPLSIPSCPPYPTLLHSSTYLTLIFFSLHNPSFPPCSFQLPLPPFPYLSPLPSLSSASHLPFPLVLCLSRP